MLPIPKVLLLTGDAQEADLLQEILGNYAFLVYARNISEAKYHLEKIDCDVLFCSWSFYQGFWNDWLQEIRECYPDLPVVILSQNGGTQELLEVLDKGAFDLLAFPCQRPTAIGVVAQAVVSHEARKLRRFAPLTVVKQRVS